MYCIPRIDRRSKEQPRFSGLNRLRSQVKTDKKRAYSMWPVRNHLPLCSEEKASKSARKPWCFNGFKKWRRNDSKSETSPLPLYERSDSEAFMG
ncbi:hypothetical protein V6N13_036880 [Hibiscus sabdariffa]